MDYSRKISERHWNLPDKGERESRREETFIDDIVQKSHIERELLANLEGEETVFDAGGGCGRFSILLARHGCRVTHLDISQSMLDKARELAGKAGVAQNITFVKGALEELDGYQDKSFDLVISFDAPISYTYPNQERVIGELVRLAKKQIMVSVSSRLGSLPYLANPVNKNQFILREDCGDPWVQWSLDHEEDLVENFSFSAAACRRLLETGLLGGEEEITEYEKGGTPWPITYGFMPEELERILTAHGVKDIRLAGPGAFARTIPNKILRKIMADPAQKKEFLDFCYIYDQNPYVCGMGKDNLFACGFLR